MVVSKRRIYVCLSSLVLSITLPSLSSFVSQIQYIETLTAGKKNGEGRVEAVYVIARAFCYGYNQKKRGTR